MLKEITQSKSMMFALALILVGVGLFAGTFIGRGLQTHVASAQDASCRPQPLSLRYQSTDAGHYLTWFADKDCPAEQYNVYIYHPDGDQLIGATQNTYFTVKNPPETGQLLYIVRAYKDRQLHGGISFSVRDAPPTPTPAPTLTPAMERELVCWYSVGGEIHSVTGARDCTIAEINHVLDR